MCLREERFSIFNTNLKNPRSEFNQQQKAKKQKDKYEERKVAKTAMGHIFTQQQFHTHTLTDCQHVKRGKEGNGERGRAEVLSVSRFISVLQSHGLFVSSMILVDV